MEGVIVSLVEGVKEKIKGMGSETVAKQLQVKVKEMIADILIDNVVEKLRFQDWVVRGYNYYYFVFFLLLFLGGCYCCCCGCAAVRGGRRRGKGAGKTMKAPGGSGRMARAVFEKNPKSYFKNLRQKQV
nr:SAM and SH3 domain-containing protein [Ipomoea batatas]